MRFCKKGKWLRLLSPLPPYQLSSPLHYQPFTNPTSMHGRRFEVVEFMQNWVKMGIYIERFTESGGDGQAKPPDKKKFITREEEPEQYWQTAGERKGENPMKTPLPYIIIFGMSTPFIILAIGFANGWIKVPVR